MQLIVSQKWRTAETVSHAARRQKAPPGIELHHTVTGRAATEGQLIAIARSIYRDHVGDRDWADVFYGFLIGDAHTLEARGWDRLSGEVPYVVVALVGNYDTGQDKLTDYQRDAILALRAETALRTYRDGRVGGLALSWHSRRDATTCPGGHVISFAEHLLRIAPDPGPEPAPTPTNDDLRDARTVALMDLLNLRNAAADPVRGRHVGNLQGLLMAAGFGPAGLVGRNGLPDGIAGRRTAECVEAFQAAHDLNPDRIVGPITWRELVTT